MKKFLLASLLAILFTLPAFSQNNFDVQHYRFEIILSDNSDFITGRATIIVKAQKNSSSLDIDLTNVSDTTKRGMLVTEVLNDSVKAKYEHKGDKIRISFPTEVKAGAEKEIMIRYTGVPRDGLIISKNKYGHRTFFADNWPNRGHNWIPCVDEPGDKATVEFLVNAPEHYQVVANGVLKEETNLPGTGNKKLTHWKEEVPISTKVMVIGAADFAVSLAGTVANCIPVYSWVYPEDRDKGFYDYALAMEILPFFIKNVGSYGYKKLANVQSKTTFGGLENANTIFYAESSVTGDRSKEYLITHEIAHQWFGNMATEKTFAHLWLSEGFATYMTVWYMENKYGKDTAVKMLEKDREEVIAFAAGSDRTVVDESPDYMQLLNANSYQKGGWILHMLRRQLGDNVFAESIKEYYAKYAGKNADTRDLQQVFEKVSGKNLAIFFDQWLYKPGIPQLDIHWKYIGAEKKIQVTIKQLQKNVFQFPLEIGIRNSSGKTTTSKLVIKDASHVFTLPTGEKVTGLVLDPQTSLLFGAKVTESK